MKILLLTTLIALGCGKHLPQENDRIIKMITKYGYPAESSTVTTQDGYILQLFRIPHGAQNKNQNTDRPAVLLMHGFMSSAEDFVYGGPSQGLAFYLADQGYDVYLGNSRGSAYGQNHTTLDPAKDAAFWRFSFHEIGMMDLPVIIDKVCDISDQNKIRYIGHMNGATAFYILASENPSYNNKIEKMISLGPIAFLQKSTHPLLKTIVENYKSQGWVIKHLGSSTFKPSNEILQDIETKCINSQKEEDVCQNIYFLLNGFNSEHFNQTTIRQALPRLPSKGSVREMLHLAQIKESGRFESFAMAPQSNPHEYDLSKISAPVAVFYASKDYLSQVDDVDTLIKKLPNVYKQQRQSDFSNNLEYIYADNIAEFYSDVVEALKPQPKYD